MELFNDNCFNVFPFINDKSIDLFVLDLPYANKDFGKCTACKWDNTIDLNRMWIEIKRMMKPNAVILFYCNTKFGFSLIKSNMKWFRYDLIWKKSRKVGFLSANRAPLRQHENIYVFSDDNNNDLDNSRNKELRDYAEKVKKYIGKTKTEIVKTIGQTIDHFLRIKSSQFGIATEETYNKLIEIYKINEMEGFIDYKTLKDKWEKEPETTYNAQKTEGKPYKTKGKGTVGVYNSKRTDNENKGDRHPTSIIEHENVYVFKDKGGTYNPQKTEREKDYKHSGKRSSEPHYGNVLECKKEYKKEDGKHPTSIIEHENVYVFKDKGGTYNPQKTEGKPYTCKEGIKNKDDLYSIKNDDRKITINKGDRHPTSIYPDTIETTILEHNNPAKSLHRTQKPVSLCEWLIKTYSNEEDTVMDFTMGSGTTGEACKNTNRKFIGVEMDEEIFKIAKDRLDV
tara:strand:- start:6559 stop:7917 length:1359 start_codon:yes stop_codon:yes gene_type:complete